MGLISNIFGFAKRCAFARELAKARVALMPGIERNIRLALYQRINDSSAQDVAGTPEYSAITITETFADLVRRGVAVEDALTRIEIHRAMLGRGKLPSPLRLGPYIAYRMGIEHPKAPGLSAAWLEMVEQACRRYFGLEVEAPPPDTGVRICRAPPRSTSEKG